MSNLRLINETNVTSSTSTVNVTDVFSADYDIYKITLELLDHTHIAASETFGPLESLGER